MVISGFGKKYFFHFYNYSFQKLINYFLLLIKIVVRFIMGNLKEYIFFRPEIFSLIKKEYTGLEVYTN